MLLYSGGLDSFCAWRLLREGFAREHWRAGGFLNGERGPLAALYVRLGHRYEAQELAAICRLQDRLPSLAGNLFTRDAPMGDYEAPDAFIPQRNVLLATVAAQDADVIYLGALRGESSRDKSGRFLRDTSRLLSYTHGERIVVAAPFRHLTKRRLFALYLRAFPDEYAANATWRETRSCYGAEHLPGLAGCGACMACFRRWVAVSGNGLRERYSSNPWEWAPVQPTRAHVRAWLVRLLSIPPAEWAGILASNREARRAIRRGRREGW